MTVRQPQIERRAGKSTTEFSVLLSADELAVSRTKPKGVSDVRWRIELRRRQSPEYFRDYGITVP